MKRLSIAYVVFALVILLVTSIKASGFTQEKRDLIVDNISIGLKSENNGLRLSSAFVLGQLLDGEVVNNNETDKVVLPLMRMLKEGKNAEEKIVAALALYKIGDARGIYNLKRTAKFDESSRVKRICSILYAEYHKEHGTEYLMY